MTKPSDFQPNGQFARGNTAAKGNKRGGRPKRATEERYLKRLLTVVNQDVFEDMVWAMVDEVIDEGNVQAFKAITSYIVGLPTVHVAVEGQTHPITLAEWKLIAAERIAQVEDLEDEEYWDETED